MWKADLPESVSVPEKLADNGRTADRAASGAGADARYIIEETDQEKKKGLRNSRRKAVPRTFFAEIYENSSWGRKKDKV